MAVPKKRTSKSKKNLRKTIWKNKASIEAKKALSKAKSIFKNLFKEKNL
uniref:Large ribosomal subunit protein bL32c n=1 Tax=Interfilum terricola TaxID=163310 RepID=A0A097KPK9_9VIRI|nr:ribosomal protein L32 [Interfilum terricola]AIT95121.1 ribosomal protein L32 [Interfilum terricola]